MLGQLMHTWTDNEAKHFPVREVHSKCAQITYEVETHTLYAVIYCCDAHRPPSWIMGQWACPNCLWPLRNQPLATGTLSNSLELGYDTSETEQTKTKIREWVHHWTHLDRKDIDIDIQL